MRHTLNLVIVDDDPDDHLLLKDALMRNHVPFHGLSLYNGQQLVDFLTLLNSGENNSTVLPDMILLDLNMPVMNGIETIKELSKMQGAKNLPVYLMSTCREPAIPDEVLKQTRGFYPKPYSQEGYTELVHSVFAPYVACV